MPTVTFATEIELIGVNTLPDGRQEIFERTHYWTGANPGEGNKFHDRVDVRVIEPGDDVSAEPQLVKDVVNGNVHTPARIADRQAARNQSQGQNP